MFAGDQVTYFTYRYNKTMKATLISRAPMGRMVEVQIIGDPFTCMVEFDRLQLIRKQPQNRSTKMPTITAKELRNQAKAAGIEGWQEMTRAELEEALAGAEDVEDEDEEFDTEEVEEDETEVEEEAAPAPRRRTASKKAPAAKTPARRTAAKAAPAKPTARAASTRRTANPATGKTAVPAARTKKVAATDEAEIEGDNPFKPGTNTHLMTEMLMKGGKRSAMVRSLVKKIELAPRVKGGADFDPEKELDYRLLRTAQLLVKEHGFVVEKDGRGPEARIKAIPPSEQ